MTCFADSTKFELVNTVLPGVSKGQVTGVAANPRFVLFLLMNNSISDPAWINNALNLKKKKKK